MSFPFISLSLTVDCAVFFVYTSILQSLISDKSGRRLEIAIRNGSFIIQTRECEILLANSCKFTIFNGVQIALIYRTSGQYFVRGSHLKKGVARLGVWKYWHTQHSHKKKSISKSTKQMCADSNEMYIVRKASATNRAMPLVDVVVSQTRANLIETYKCVTNRSHVLLTTFWSHMPSHIYDT